MDPRAEVFKAITAFYRTRGDGKYAVKRGLINWALYPFTNKQLAISVSMARGSLLPNHASLGTRSCAITLEIIGRVEFSSDACCETEDGTSVESTEIDDDFLTGLLDDVEACLHHLMRKATDVPIGYESPVIFKVNPSTAQFTELHDAIKSIQGIVVNFEVDY